MSRTTVYLRGKTSFAACLLWAAGGLPTVRGEPSVTLLTVDLEKQTGSLISFTHSGGAVLRGESSAEYRRPVSDVVRIVAATPSSDPRPAEHILTLVGGNQLRGRIVRTEDERLRFETVEIGTLAVPMDQLLELCTAPERLSAHRRTVELFRATPSSREDRILLTNGDVLSGFVSTLDVHTINIETDTGTHAVALNRLVAARLNPSPPPNLPKPFFRLTLSSGTTLTAKELNWAGETAEATFLFGDAIRFPSDRIAQLDVVGGRWEWLTDHEPASAVHTPAFSLDWPVVKDRNVLGGPLRVASAFYSRGLGVHSRSHLIYELHGSYREFITSFGLDDNSGPLGDVSVLVLVDGMRRLEQASVQRGTLFGPYRLDVSRAARMELIVDFGKNGDTQDRLNWLEPALVRDP